MYLYGSQRNEKNAIIIIIHWCFICFSFLVSYYEDTVKLLFRQFQHSIFVELFISLKHPFLFMLYKYYIHLYLLFNALTDVRLHILINVRSYSIYTLWLKQGFSDKYINLHQIVHKYICHKVVQNSIKSYIIAKYNVDISVVVCTLKYFLGLLN